MVDERALQFYGQSEQHLIDLLREASGISGFDVELGVLRVQMRRLREDTNADPELVLKTARLIASMVASRYRMTPRDAEHLSDALAQVVEQLGQHLGAGESEEV